MQSESIQIEREAGLPQGFQAAGLAAGIKSGGGLDLALMISDSPASVAGTFTTNPICAAPVQLSRSRVAAGTARAVVVNSGNANACTGEPGLRDAERMAACAADALDLPPEDVLVCSTGHIGDRLPMPVIESGIVQAAEALSPDGGPIVARAIMTTDTRPKFARVGLTAGGADVTLTGLAKGAGMIEPNMATMLGFVFTDAAVQPAALQGVLRDVVDRTFNRISVDGDQSTNDTVLAFANGAAGGDVLEASHPDWPAFRDALHAVLFDLALQIVDDGEGAHKRITIAVEGAADDGEADRAARAVARSFLVKTSWAGTTANWGRVLAAIGQSGVGLTESALAMDYNGIPAVRSGVSAGGDPAELDRQVTLPALTLRIDLGLGTGRAVLYTCECTEEYVRINMD